MTHSAKIICDSLSPDGIRLTTMVICLPRIVLAELNTHRMLSKSSASSRAIPVSKMIQMVEENPYIPSHWGKNQSGMQAGEDVCVQDKVLARHMWLGAKDQAILKAEELLKLGIHKQLTNRLLEPFMWHTVIITATEWSNFFHLRNNPKAHPDIAAVAALMQTAYEKNVPSPLDYGEWHTPYIMAGDYSDVGMGSSRTARKHSTAAQEVIIRISIARCARVSYLNHEGKREVQKDVDLYTKLLGPGHMAPFEHVARPINNGQEDQDLPLLVHPNDGKWLEEEKIVLVPNEKAWCGNFRGWVQHRKLIPHEHDILGVR